MSDLTDELMGKHSALKVHAQNLWSIVCQTIDLLN